MLINDAISKQYLSVNTIRGYSYISKATRSWSGGRQSLSRKDPRVTGCKVYKHVHIHWHPIDMNVFGILCSLLQAINHLLIMHIIITKASNSCIWPKMHCYCILSYMYMSGRTIPIHACSASNYTVLGERF
jgi:hypothetical protein